MKLPLLEYILLLLILVSCKHTQKNCSTKEIEKHFQKGNFAIALQLSQELQKNCDLTQKETRQLDSIANWIYRIKNDFSLTESQVKNRIQAHISHVTNEMLRNWEERNVLEMKMIDGERRYFNRSVSNLFLLDSLAASYRYKEGLITNSLTKFRLKHTQEIIDRKESVKQQFVCNYTITLQADAVPAEEKVRCWLPFPSDKSTRQAGIKLISANDDDYKISQKSNHHSVYMEKIAKSGEPLIFNIVFLFNAASQYVHPELLSKSDNNYPEEVRQYREERLPHIQFTSKIKHLTDSLTKGLVLPYEKVNAIYYWIDKNIPWAGALEYGTMPQIPTYVLKNRHGDCGMQTLLFISMVRCAGIPARWQSGWMLHPNEVNLHDWCEVYYSGIGWVPVDQSFGLQPDDNQLSKKDFYISGIDSYRLIVNDDFSHTFDPAKKHWRSEPVDFQRGELEWKGGNIYFDKWNYNMKVQYVTP